MGEGGCNDIRVGGVGYFGVVSMMIAGVGVGVGGGTILIVGLVLLLFVLALLLFLDNLRCSFGERGMTTVEPDKPNLEKRGVTS